MATQSLYRRYRPRRFSELKGQDHVVRALRDAVAQGREGQAYLFSGPRGTGKTTSARILAKVLNCDNVVDGEPCCMCESCKAVENGTSYDVHELDAASNNGVDAIRDLVEKASLGSPGRHKVYILDEVHMLSKAAEAALLKTLEEPPPHVVFVLATTDPQKMSDTIRSRTQHLQFHLLPSDTLAEHVKWVADDAGYDLPQAALDAALVRGGGSARDTLSALELLASTGGDTSDIIDLDEFLTALIDRDPGRVLTAMGHAVSLGRDPRTITEDLVRHLRNAFLSLMAPELVVLPPDQLDVIAGKAQELGAAGLVRAIERLGEALVDMRHAPDPRILVEVALVQLTSDQAGGDATAFAARIDRLESQLHELREHGVGGGAAAPPRDPQTGRAKLGGAATGSRPAPTESSRREPSSAPANSSPTASSPPQQSAPGADGSRSEPTDARGRAAEADAAGEAAGAGEAAQAGAGAVAADPPRPVPASTSVPEAWNHVVKSQLKGLARPLFAAGEFVGERDGAWLFEVPNEAHGAKCEVHRPDVEAALSAAVGSPVTIRIVADGAPAAAATSPTAPASASGSAVDAPAAGATPGPSRPNESAFERAQRAAASDHDDEPEAPAYVPPPDDEVDLSELTDAPPEAVKSPIDRLAEAFPGSELMRDD